MQTAAGGLQKGRGCRDSARNAASLCLNKMKSDNRLRKTAAIFAILSVVLGGCVGEKKHTAEELKIISTCCGHMSWTMSYSFTFAKVDDEWQFSAGCFVDMEDEERLELENQPITEEEAQELLRIIREQDLIKSIRKYRKPYWRNFIQVLDETTYSTMLRFADGTEYDAEKSVGPELQAFCYRLADKYKEAGSTEAIEE